jgi:cation diffusion facilitator family transporter
MRFGRQFVFPERQQEPRHRAARLSWISLGLLISTAIAVYVTLGQSEAMKTAWVEDLLGMVPPIVLLAALKIENRAPNKRFPYGYFRTVSVAFLVTSAVLTLAGLWLLYDSVMKLLHGERPPVGTMSVFGHLVWAGWAMVVALVYCVGIGYWLGRAKRPVADTLNDKALYADADMNKAGWTSEGAAIIGILLIGYGHWWGDGMAAAFISLNIVRDGWVNLRQVIGDLMDETPTQMGGRELEDLPERLKACAESMPWVAQAAVRLREHGHVIAGEVLVVPRDEQDLVSRIERAVETLTKVDWRIYTLTVMPVSELKDGVMPKQPSPAA